MASQNFPVKVRVIDISHHNEGIHGAEIDFDAIYASGVRGVIHKVTQGTDYVDKTCEKRRQAILDAGLLFGMYHFATGDDADEQVAHFMDSAQPDANTLMALDHEPNKGNELDLAGARQFLETLAAKLGRKPILYSGNLIKEQTGHDDSHNDFFGDVRLWLCQYGPRAVLPDPWEDYFLWQFSGDSIANRGFSVPGIANGDRVDMNTFDGTDEELAAAWKA